MERLEVGKFYAARFDKKVYEFIVYNDGTMDCPKLNAKSVYRLIIKPRFMLFSKEKCYLSPAKHGIKDGLIKDYIIEDYLFNYLKQNGMIRYSIDMAYLYDFIDKKGYDYEFKEKSPFKRAIKKGPVLVKQRKGEFN